jgi:intein-encoded DNA endonuclease-like protein
MEMNSYITGFVDGEGSFLVSFSKRSKMNTGIEVRPAFTVSQHKRNKDILFSIQKHFGCGTVRFNTRDETWKYEVRSLSDLTEKIIPHFNQFPLQTSKRLDFERFKEICQLMIGKRHRTLDGLQSIIATAYQMNNFGARRQEKYSLLTIVSKMKV